jgi:hypothetical protein
MNISFVCYLLFFCLLFIDLLSQHYYLKFMSLIQNTLIIIQFNCFDLELLEHDFEEFNSKIKLVNVMEIQFLRNLYFTIKQN